MIRQSIMVKGRQWRSGLAAFVFSCLCACTGQSTYTGVATAPKEAVQAPIGEQEPSFTIYPYLQLPSHTSMTVMFETADIHTKVWARPEGSQAAFQKVPAQAINTDAVLKQATLTKLDANTRYEYFILSVSPNKTKSVSKKYVFKTYPAPGTSVGAFNLLAISDTQNNETLGALSDVINKGVIPTRCGGVASHCADSIIGITISGDIVNKGGEVHQWRLEFFDQLKDITPYVPLVPVPGNHDYASATDLSNYLHFFQLPVNGSAGFEEQWYSVDYANLRLIGLNSYPISKNHGNFQSEILNTQRKWLKGVLANTASDQGIDYTLGMFHHPCLSELWLSGESNGSCELVAEFEDFSKSSGKISGHLFGHTHAYSRGQSMDTYHLWLNAATASGYRERMNKDEYYNNEIRDYDNFELSHSAFGFNILSFNPTSDVAMKLQRYRATVKTKADGYVELEDTFTVFDALTIKPEQGLSKPNIISTNRVNSIESLVLKFEHSAVENIHEVQWQLSRAEAFGKKNTFDVWGNDTRQRNIWTKQDGTIEGALYDTQDGVDITRLDIADLSGHYLMGGQEYLKWQKRESEHSHSSFRDPYHGERPPVLNITPGQQWYWRVRVRDSQLNWSGWSDIGRIKL
jgi:Calcineurin-like phosphoesterase